MDGKLRILCIHGYRQDGTKLRQQTGALRKILKNTVEMVFISAPFQVPGEEETARSWWFTQHDSFSSRDSPADCQGLQDSVKVVEDAWQNMGPFHGLLGFSQGACLVGILSALCQRELTKLSPQFVVIISGFKSQCKAHCSSYEETIRIPSLHVMGENDEVIPVSWSHDLAAVFENPQILVHPGGHFVPGTSSLKNQYVKFLQQFQCRQ